MPYRSNRALLHPPTRPFMTPLQFFLRFRRPSHSHGEMRCASLSLLLTMTWTAFAGTAPITYPETRVDEVTDEYHGTKIVDPYR